MLEAIRLKADLQAPHYSLALLELVRAYQTPDDKTPCLRGLEHIRQAIEVGPERADVYYAGATLYALAAQREPTFQSQALDYLEYAIRLGLPPSRLENDIIGFKAVAENPRFRRLIGMPSSQSPSEPTNQLVDPILD